MRKPVTFILALGVLLAIFVAGYTAWTRFRPPYPVAIGTPIRHDDFLFTVTGVKKLVLPRGAAMYRVSINVTNEAKVVDYQWRDSIAYVRAFDKDGYGHDFFPLSSRAFTIQPGQSQIAQVEFQVPA